VKYGRKYTIIYHQTKLLEKEIALLHVMPDVREGRDMKRLGSEVEMEITPRCF